MTVLMWAPLAGPCLLAGVAAARPANPVARWAPALAALVVLATGGSLLLAGRVVTAAGGALRSDAVTAFMLTTVGAVALTAVGGGIRTTHRWYPVLLSLFLASMSLAVLADNLGVTWVAIEATTITTAFLVGQHHGSRPLEAAWKYVVLGSVGVAIAFLGIVILYATARAAGQPTLSWVALTQHPAALDRQAATVGIVLATLGFATKAGLAPMHAWLPDAHSQAPAPVSGLMSGVLLSVAMYVILRLRAVGDVVLGADSMRPLLLILGVTSLTVGAVLTLTQRDYKRLLAYSSIEHMGLMAVAAGIGGRLATAALLVHMLGHGLSKAAMFVQAGRVLSVTGSSRTADVQALLTRHPGLGGPWLAGMAALLGFPPFLVFFSEVAIVVAGWRAGLAPVMVVVVGLLLVAFTGLTRHALAMTLGPAAPVDPAAPATAATQPPPLPAGPGRSGRIRVPAALVATATLVLTAPVTAPALTAATTALVGTR
jgi:hydrogenase-4 component F